ncbi:membrane protein insertase YidC [Nevskia soli]|uniref:membrane protein insertase YidC n=1 Tax=Nevskia soli TaxID=418856 RepID=UPI0004A6C3DF|nr:membrane protein insertase YidC [Nevskia soli]
MENRRMVLVAFLGLFLFLLYQAWETDYAKPAQTQQSGNASGVAADAAGKASTAAAGATDVAPAAGTLTQQHVQVQTDLLMVDIALAGGEIRRVELSDYSTDKKHPDQKLALLDDRNGELFTLLSGIAGSEQPLSSNQSSFTSPQAAYKLADGAATLDVPLEYTDASGYSVRKVFHFKRDSYEIGVTQTLVNHSGKELQAASFLRYQRTPPPAEAGPGFMHTAGGFLGIGVYQQDKPGSSDYAYKKKAFKDLDKAEYDVKQTGGWIAMLQKYFVVAVIPPPDQAAEFSGKKNPSSQQPYQAQYTGVLAPVADGTEHSYDSRLYIGPIAQGKMEGVAPGFELTEDYGILKSVAKPLFWVLSQYHKLTGNWGWSIILLTLTVKALFFKLSEAQYRSTAKMKKFSPRIKELRERFGDDRERLNKAMMELYKKEGFNPLAGCWPLLVQMPVFFALYWVLAQSVELRQAPFILWMQDLSGPDQYYILPVLYGISMWVQQRLSGQSATMDPTQAKMMNIMPIFLTGLFLFFPVGLVLYWLVSNLTNILQQWVIARRLEAADLKKGELVKK